MCWIPGSVPGSGPSALSAGPKPPTISALLSHLRDGDGLRHHFLLGGAYDHDGH